MCFLKQRGGALVAELFENSTIVLLQKTALFLNLPTSRLRELLENRGTIRKFSTDEVLYDPHHFQRAMGIILSGRLKVNTEHEVVLTVLDPGSIFGVAGLFLDRNDYVSVIRALQPSVVLFLTAEDLEIIFKEEFLICHNYLRFLSQRIVFLNQKISSFAAPTPAEALFTLLNQLAPVGENQTFHLALSKQELCRRLNISRTSLYRAWQQLIREGRLTEHSDSSLQMLSQKSTEEESHQ